MNNRIIDVVQYFNYLGIMLDADMSWENTCSNGQK